MYKEGYKPVTIDSKGHLSPSVGEKHSMFDRLSKETHVFDNMGSMNYGNIELAKSEILRRPVDREIQLTSRQR